MVATYKVDEAAGVTEFFFQKMYMTSITELLVGLARDLILTVRREGERILTGLACGQGVEQHGQ